jgi:hypothetical protein
MNKIVENLKKMHDAQRIENKDFSLKHLFVLSNATINKLTKPYQQEDGSAILPVVGLASKYVRKYDNENNPGYHTTVYLKDGKKTGAFSTALYEFAQYFYEQAGMGGDSTFKKLEFNGCMNVKVTKVDLDGGHTTYNFEIVEGDVTGATLIGTGTGGQLLIGGSTEQEAANEPETEKEPESKTDVSPVNKKKK